MVKILKLLNHIYSSPFVSYLYNFVPVCPEYLISKQNPGFEKKEKCFSIRRSMYTNLGVLLISSEDNSMLLCLQTKDKFEKNDCDILYLKLKCSAVSCIQNQMRASNGNLNFNWFIWELGETESSIGPRAGGKER